MWVVWITVTVLAFVVAVLVSAKAHAGIGSSNVETGKLVYLGVGLLLISPLLYAVIAHLWTLPEVINPIAKASYGTTITTETPQWASTIAWCIAILGALMLGVPVGEDAGRRSRV